MTKRHMTCCVCGCDAGRWEQHWNRDEGYGICVDCAEAEAKRLDRNAHDALYGQPGINYEAPKEPA